MNNEELAEKAAELKQSGRYNCCQAVTQVLKDEVKVDEDTLNKLTSGFAVGMGNMEGNCGAMLGACMIASLKIGNPSSVLYTRKIQEGFKDKCGSITCKELKGKTEKHIYCSCEDCVRNAVIAYKENIQSKQFT